MRLLRLSLAALVLNGCGSDPESASTLLEPMSDSEWRANIHDGVGCSLLQGDELLLLYIVDHGAIAKIGGKIQRMTGGKSGFAWDGDRYRGGGASVEITATEDPTRRVIVRVQSGGQSETFEGRWGCGS